MFKSACNIFKLSKCDLTRSTKNNIRPSIFSNPLCSLQATASYVLKRNFSLSQKVTNHDNSLQGSNNQQAAESLAKNNLGKELAQKVNELIKSNSQPLRGPLASLRIILQNSQVRLNYYDCLLILYLLKRYQPTDALLQNYDYVLEEARTELKSALTDVNLRQE